MIIFLFRKMYRSTTELDDEDTINEHRRYRVANPEHAREKAIRTKMRDTLNIMNGIASKILKTEIYLCKEDNAVTLYSGSSRLIADMWQIVMKMIYDEQLRTAASISVLEEYTNMLGAHARLIKQMSSTLEKLLVTKNAYIAKKSATMSQLVDEQGESFLDLVIESHDEIKDKKLHWQQKSHRIINDYNKFPP